MGGGEEGARGELPLRDLQDAPAETELQTHHKWPFICPNSGARDGAPGAPGPSLGRHDGVLAGLC